ncbi:MAG: UDP-N-acetylmuramyl-tripeptide synthetase [Candidatus Taylorbacteria bacterium]|nr:UDP-N-acetylmuramyl-tripeptide synthetase [Candidatus Taylorbacteria bacterium]
MLDNTLAKIRRFIPTKLFHFFQPAYHYSLALAAALWYSFPSRHIKVIGVTGTKGKSSTTEILNAILEEAGYRTAVSNTIRHKIGDESFDNLYKMSMPGRFFVQRLIRKAVKAKCDYVILEMTSQGTLLYRHKFLHLDAFVFTNLSPEHIDSHGSFENYAAAKAKIACEMIHSKKAQRTIIVNGDDKEAGRFLTCEADKKMTYSAKDVEPYEILKQGITFTFGGKEHGRKVASPLSGLFNLYNILAAANAARSQGVNDDTIARAITKFTGIKGRVERIEAGQKFTVIVDYAHTPDSLEKLYQVFETSSIIAILGGTGGGRDNWKRKEMGRLADRYCDDIILTDEDPYDEDPKKIVADVAAGITEIQPTIIMDRREAIREAIRRAGTNPDGTPREDGGAGIAILITGKGTDPYIMGPNNTKTPWGDSQIAHEELHAFLARK